MSTAYRRAVRFLTSAGLVSVLLGLIGVWSVLGTIVPQGDPTRGRAFEWASANPALAPVVETVGLYDAYRAPAFLVLIGVLALSTVLCSWQRTTVAARRSRALRAAAQGDPLPTLTENDALIGCADCESSAAALSSAERALDGLGITTRRSGDALVSASWPFAPWGSPVFHWALVGFMLFVLIGSFVRADGLIGLAVGQVKPDAPESYGKLSTGSWHSWDGVSRSFRLDGFEPRFSADGIDHGPVPTVSVLDAEGNVLKTQMVYPNKMLHLGSLKIGAPAYGLSVTLTLLDEAGTVVGTAVQLVDFDQSALEGTIPLEPLAVTDETGAPVVLVHATVPLIAENGRFVEWLPKDAPVRIAANTGQGEVLVDEIVDQGAIIDLIDGLQLRVDDVGWYSRLSILDDWTIPFIYGWMILAALALSVTVFTRQQYVVVAAHEGPEGIGLAVRMRLWRHASTTRDEITEALAQALHSEGDEAE